MSKANKKKPPAESPERIYKKRHSVYERVLIVIFVTVLLITGLCLALLTRPAISETEKRSLAEKPRLTVESYFDGSFADDFTVWFSDTVPFREQIVQLSSQINKLKGISAPAFYGDVNVVADDEGNSVDEQDDADISQASNGQTLSVGGDNMPVITTAPEETVPEAESESTAAADDEEEVDDIAEFANNGIVVDSVEMYGDNAGVMLFGGSKTCGTRYAELLSAYKNALGDDINVYNMVVPTSAEFYLPKKFQKFSSSEKDAIDHIYQSYTADVIPIDAYSEIAAHTDEYIYLRTDHHWSQRGAYYAYVAFCKALGQTPPDIDTDYEVGTKEGFVGSLYNYTNDATLKNSPEVFTYYKPTSDYDTYYYDYRTLESKGKGTLFFENVSGGNCYGMFLGADAIHTKIVTGLDTGRKICVFKESYGNAFVPFLVDSFDEIYVIDIRYFGRNAVEYIKENSITDVMFINNAFAANTNSLIDGIEELLYNEYGTLEGEDLTVAQQYRAAQSQTLPADTAPAADSASAADLGSVTDTASVTESEAVT